MNRKLLGARKLFAKLLLVFMGFLFGCVIAEVALRVAGYSYPELYQRDEVCGIALRPGAEGWYRKEGEAYVRINSDGLRDQEHALTKTPDTFRIALLGDSYCEALSVPLEEAFWWLMRRDLEACGAFGGKKIEVINFGVSGFGTAHELLTLREKVWKYSPDLVLLAITTSNDIIDNSRALKNTNDVPYFVYQGDRLILDDSFKQSRAFLFNQSKIGRLGKWLRIHSRLTQAISEGQRALKVRLALWRAKRSASSVPNSQHPGNTGDIAKTPNKSDLFARSQELGLDNLIYLEPNNAVWNDAWRVTEGLLVQMRDEVKSRGAGLVVVTLSNGPQVLPEPSVRENFKRNFGVTDLFYPDNRIRQACEREGIPAITLAPQLQEYAERNKVFLHGFGEDIGNGHWNPSGHRVAGEILAKELCERALLK